MSDREYLLIEQDTDGKVFQNRRFGKDLPGFFRSRMLHTSITTLSIVLLSLDAKP